MYLHPRRAAALIENAAIAAKQGTKPFPYVMVTIEPDTITTCGIGQHVMVEDYEVSGDRELGRVDSVAIGVKEAEAVASAIKKVPGAGRKDSAVSVTIRDAVLTVEDGDDTIVEVADIGEESDPAWNRYEFASEVQNTAEPAQEFVVYDVSILAVLSKLKPSGEQKRAVIYPRWAGDTSRFEMGSCRGFIQANITPPDDLKFDQGVFELGEDMELMPA